MTCAVVNFGETAERFPETLNIFAAAPAHGNKPCSLPSLEAAKSTDNPFPTHEVTSHVSVFTDFLLIPVRFDAICLNSIVKCSEREGPASGVLEDVSFFFHHCEHSSMNGSLIEISFVWSLSVSLLVIESTSFIFRGVSLQPTWYSSTTLTC